MPKRDDGRTQAAMRSLHVPWAVDEIQGLEVARDNVDDAIQKMHKVVEVDARHAFEMSMSLFPVPVRSRVLLAKACTANECGSTDECTQEAKLCKTSKYWQCKGTTANTPYVSVLKD